MKRSELEALLASMTSELKAGNKSASVKSAGKSAKVAATAKPSKKAVKADEYEKRELPEGYEFSIEDGICTLTFPIEKALSNKGKSVRIGCTHGNVYTGEFFKGRAGGEKFKSEIQINLNAYAVIPKELRNNEDDDE